MAVPSSRLARLARLGGMASGVMGGMAVDGARQFAQGRRPELRDLLLTPSNVTRVADQLARMRGAAMKVGQLMSMDAGDMLPPELADIMARLRADADHMPPAQLKTVLNENWGKGWLRQFETFDVHPIAAASIGQVHRAKTKDQRDLAIKVQYPGVRKSIDSDVDNVAALIRMSGLLTRKIDVAPLLAEAKRQLHEEADYEQEGRYLEAFRELLSADGDLVLPELHQELTTPNVLAMSYVDGVPIEQVADAPQAERDRVMAILINLLLRELFEFHFMQTDPNFANYRYDPASGRVVLLDFGAARRFPSDVANSYHTLLLAGLSGSRADIHAAARAIGFFDDDTAPHHRDTIVEMIDIAFSALRHDGPFDFANTDIADQLHEAGQALGMDQEFVHVPPVDAFYMQRKFAGLYLLAHRLRARVNVRELLEPYVSD